MYEIFYLVVINAMKKLRAGQEGKGGRLRRHGELFQRTASLRGRHMRRDRRAEAGDRTACGCAGRQAQEVSGNASGLEGQDHREKGRTPAALLSGSKDTWASQTRG